MKIILGVLLVINAMSAVLNITRREGVNNAIGISNLVVAIFLAVALTIEMVED